MKIADTNVRVSFGWVDVNLLVSALSEKHLVFTFDVNLAAVCREFKCSFN